jgi:hypothetical protein
MPINATPTRGLSDHIDDVRSHTGRRVDVRVVTDGSLLRRPFPSRAPEGAHHVLVLAATSVLRRHDYNERWGSGG